MLISLSNAVPGFCRGVCHLSKIVSPLCLLRPALPAPLTTLVPCQRQLPCPTKGASAAISPTVFLQDKITGYRAFVYMQLIVCCQPAICGYYHRRPSSSVNRRARYEFCAISMACHSLYRTFKLDHLLQCSTALPALSSCQKLKQAVAIK